MTAREAPVLHTAVSMVRGSPEEEPELPGVIVTSAAVSPRGLPSLLSGQL